MMHRCNSSSNLGACSCGLYHTQANSFSMLLSMTNGHRDFDDGETVYSSSNNSSSVDCTLSLGMPSMRNEKKRTSSFEGNVLPSKVHCPMPSTTKTYGDDPLLARRCANCDTTSTPLWRNGPKGPKSLCNACGIRFKKEERRATSVVNTTCNNGAATYEAVETEHVVMNATWVQPQKMPCYASAYDSDQFLFTEDDVDCGDMETGIPFLSWRFNVTDRPTLVHDFR